MAERAVQGISYINQTHADSCFQDSSGSTTSVHCEALGKISGHAVLAFDDPVWAEISVARVSIPRHLPREAVERACGLWTAEIARRDQAGRTNYRHLLRHAIQRLARCTSRDNTRVGEEHLRPALNLTILVRASAKHLVEALPPSEVAELFGAGERAWPSQPAVGHLHIQERIIPRELSGSSLFILNALRRPQAFCDFWTWHLSRRACTKLRKGIPCVSARCSQRSC